MDEGEEGMLFQEVDIDSEGGIIIAENSIGGTEDDGLSSEDNLLSTETTETHDKERDLSSGEEGQEQAGPDKNEEL
jgi:hypothetical protein